MKIFSFIWRALNNLRRAFQILLMLLIIGLIFAGMSDTEFRIPSSAALVVAPTGVLVDQLAGDALERAVAEAQGTGVPQTLLTDVTDSLTAAARDERIKAVVLSLDGLTGGGLPKLQAVAEALGAVRDAGKPIIAVGDGFTQDQYYLAAHADEIYLHQLGLLYIDGYGYFRMYLKGIIDKLKVDLNVFRVGKYKSFVEPFIRDDMSAADRQASQRWLDTLWAAYKRDVSAARGIEPEQIDNYANRFVEKLRASRGNTAQVALDSGLVDSLAGEQEIRERLVDLVGPSDYGDGNYSAVDFRDYLLHVRARQIDAPGKPKIGVLVASGQIVDGEASAGTIGGDSLAALIDQATEDDSIQALVLRVDSPGGSMFASEVVFDRLLQLKLKGKPLVVSMSTVAASGGYYIAMLADQVWASETTITGSIGVGALVPTFQRSLDGVGIHIDGFGTTQLAGQFRPDRALGEQAQEMLQLSVEEAYRIFVGKVAEARGMSFERADNLAQGRVWIGSDALAIGLVDELGGLDDAVQAAAGLAGLDEGDYGRRTIAPDLGLLDRIVMQFAGQAGRALQALGVRPRGNGTGSAVGRFIARVQADVEALTGLNDPRGIYYHCFCTLP